MFPEGEMRILLRTERSMVIRMFGVHLKDRKTSTDSMLMLGLNETIHQLPMESSVYWHGYVLRKEDVYIFRRTLDFEIEGLRMKGRLKRT